MNYLTRSPLPLCVAMGRNLRVQSLHTGMRTNPLHRGLSSSLAAGVACVSTVISPVPNGLGRGVYRLLYAQSLHTPIL